MVVLCWIPSSLLRFLHNSEVNCAPLSDARSVGKECLFISFPVAEKVIYMQSLSRVLDLDELFSLKRQSDLIDI